MGKNWAIVVGINNYDNLQSLNYAKRDAEAMKAWFENEAKFDRVFLFTEDSPAIQTNPPIKTQPTYGRFLTFLQVQFETKLLEPQDNLYRWQRIINTSSYSLSLNAQIMLKTTILSALTPVFSINLYTVVMLNKCSFLIMAGWIVLYP